MLPDPAFTLLSGACRSASPLRTVCSNCTTNAASPPPFCCTMAAITLSLTPLPVRRSAAAKCASARSAFTGRCLALPLAPVRGPAPRLGVQRSLLLGTDPQLQDCGQRGGARSPSLRPGAAACPGGCWNVLRAAQVARAPRSVAVRATYETEKTEVDVDQIVKDLQTKVRGVAADRGWAVGRFPGPGRRAKAELLTRQHHWVAVGPCGEQDVRGGLRRRRGGGAVAVVHPRVGCEQRAVGERPMLTSKQPLCHGIDDAVPRRT